MCFFGQLKKLELFMLNATTKYCSYHPYSHALYTCRYCKCNLCVQCAKQVVNSRESFCKNHVECLAHQEKLNSMEDAGKSTTNILEGQANEIEEMRNKSIATKKSSFNPACIKCNIKLHAKPKLTFLGFQKLKCPECSKNNIYQLKKWYLWGYWSLGLGSFYALTKQINQGGWDDVIMYLSFIVFASYLIIKDARLRKRIETYQ